MDFPFRRRNQGKLDAPDPNRDVLRVEAAAEHAGQHYYGRKRLRRLGDHHGRADEEAERLRDERREEARREVGEEVPAGAQLGHQVREDDLQFSFRW